MAMSVVQGAWVANGKYLPFVSVANVDSTKPYTTGGSYIIPGPFNGQFNNIMNYTVDAIMVDFIETEAAINCKGRL